MATIVNLFLDSTEFSGATAVYTDIDLTIKAPDGFYTYGTLNREQLGGLLQVGAECSTIQPCPEPVDCVVSAWSDWSVCSGGTQTRTRTIITPASGGGTPCPVLEESQPCTVPTACIEYTISTTASFGTTTTYLDCTGVEQQQTIGGVSGYDATTFCAQENTVNTGVETTLTINGPCPEPQTVYKGVLYDFSTISNPEIYSIQEFGPFGGYERITLLNGSTIKEYNWAPTILCTDTPVNTITISETSKTFAKYAIWNDITVQVVGEFWMDSTTPTDRATWQSASTKKYSPFELC